MQNYCNEQLTGFFCNHVKMKKDNLQEYRTPKRMKRIVVWQHDGLYRINADSNTTLSTLRVDPFSRIFTVLDDTHCSALVETSAPHTACLFFSPTSKTTVRLIHFVCIDWQLPDTFMKFSNTRVVQTIHSSQPRGLLQRCPFKLFPMQYWFLLSS